eukprot:SAG11_NODE_1419_length_4957_cov_3.968711_7_plen_85_part_00
MHCVPPKHLQVEAKLNLDPVCAVGVLDADDGRGVMLRRASRGGGNVVVVQLDGRVGEQHGLKGNNWVLLWRAATVHASGVPIRN